MNIHYFNINIIEKFRMKLNRITRRKENLNQRNERERERGKKRIKNRNENKGNIR
jgi:hypothetical protein